MHSAAVGCGKLSTCVRCIHTDWHSGARNIYLAGVNNSRYTTFMGGARASKQAPNPCVTGNNIPAPRYIFQNRIRSYCCVDKVRHVKEDKNDVRRVFGCFYRFLFSEDRQSDATDQFFIGKNASRDPKFEFLCMRCMQTQTCTDAPSTWDKGEVYSFERKYVRGTSCTRRISG